MIRRSYLIGIVLILSLASCENKSEKRDISRVLDKLIGKEIVVPDSLVTIFTTSSMNKHRDYNVQIHSYVDGDCDYCLEDFHAWNKFYSENEFSNEVNFNFYLRAESYKMIKKDFKDNNFPFPFIQDPKIEFVKQNQLPLVKMYQTLLTIDNKIVLVGNPMHNRKILELYVKTINEELFGKEIIGAE